MTDPKPKSKLRGCLMLFGIAFLVLLVLGTIGFFALNESKPEGKTGAEADALTEKMFTAINKAAWDSTGVVNWTFKGLHTFLWDKNRHYTRVRWDGGYEVFVNINERTGVAFKDSVRIADPGENASLVNKAWEFWCNDSFWLNAPVKAFDPGTTRSIVPLENGGEGLMVTYGSGGVTPGDSYLWILDENARPTSWKMWVKIIPIGGLEFTWENWTPLSTGAKVATFHHSSVLNLDITDLKAAKTLVELEENDPFKVLIP